MSALSRINVRPAGRRPALLCFAALAFAAEAQHTQPYVWKSVQMVGGGFVDGIVFHPTAKGVRYARTDIGGAYRWNDATNRWEPLLDWLPYEDTNLMGVESIALDPSDANRVYLACGMYTNASSPNGAVLLSPDRGRTFQRVNVPFKMGGNENGRGNGERMAVDPHNGRIIYLGTRHDGLWRSTDRGLTWKRVESFPDIAVKQSGPAWRDPNAGIIFVVFGPKSAIYVGASLMNRDNLFRSTDAGKSWHAVPAQPTQYRPHRAALASDGFLYIAYGTDPGPMPNTDGGVWKLNTANDRWTDVTPDKPDASRKFGYAAVAVDHRNPQALIASSFYRPGGEELFRSTDGGAHWRPIFHDGGGTYDFSLAPYVAHTPIHWLFDIEIDPANPDHALFTTGYGGYETFDLRDADAGKPTRWSVMTTGIEETVALDLLSPPRGAPLLTAIGDYGGFVHWDLDKPAPEGNYDHPHFGNTNSLACAENAPDIIVRVGHASGDGRGGNIGYSLDGGKSWQPTASTPQTGSMLGHVAVSADGATWVWTPDRKAVSYTLDRGATWEQSQGIPANVQVIADRVNPRKFYALALFDGKLYVSSDGAANFTERPLKLPDGIPPKGGNRGDDRGGQDRIYATPGHEGDLWLPAFNGLYHSMDTGASWNRLAQVLEIHAFGFGKGALYLVGVVDGVRGVYRSDDTARSWTRINDDQHQWGLILQITGDPKQYGRVYVGTHGCGTLYGDPK